MAKQKFYNLYSLNKPHEIASYEERNYQTEILERLISIARLYDDDDNDFEEEEEDFSEDDITDLLDDEELKLPIFDRNQKWRTKLLREYFFGLMKLAA